MFRSRRLNQMFRTRQAGKTFVLVCFYFLFLPLLVSQNAHAEFNPENSPLKWELLKTDHFYIYYQEGLDLDYVRQVARESEYYYDEITDSLGFRRFDFWTWENRAKIILFDSHETYLKHTGSVHWSYGHARVVEKEIHTFLWASNFTEHLLPHELTHIIFREMVGYKLSLPLWFDEGIAIYHEQKARKFGNEIVRKMVEENLSIPFAAMWRHSAEDLEDPPLFYAQSASMVGYLLRNYRGEEFYRLIKGLKEKMNLEKAISRSYGFKDMVDFELTWMAHIREHGHV